MFIEQLNFAQPLWFIMLLLIPLSYLWQHFYQKRNASKFNNLQKLADPILLPHIILSMGNSTQSNKSYQLIYCALVFCLSIALANPRWSYKEVEAYAPTANLVILLDLGQSMSYSDINPSRIARARQRVEDLINQSRGLKIGVIGFAAVPHLITPITDDMQTIKGFLPAIDTSLITKQGDNLKDALDSATQLLESEPGYKKSILLVSDGNFASLDYSSQIKAITSKEINVHVMGIGSSNLEKMRKIANLGQGLYVDANYSEATINKVLNKVQQQDPNKQVVSGKIKQYEDRYYLFLLPAVAICLWLFRHRVTFSFYFVITLALLNSSDANALDIAKYFKNKAQLGYEQYKEGNYKQAAELFSDPYQKGVALYRNKEYAQAEAQFNANKRQDAKARSLYNAGNAQMQQQKWQNAVSSYEKVLAMEPENLDAKHNLEIAKKMLAQNPKQNDQKKNDQDKDSQEKEKQDTKNENEENEENEQNDTNANTKEQKSEDKKTQEDSNDEKQNEADKSNDSKTQDSKLDSELNERQDIDQDEKAKQWLNRIDSDIRVFLKRKFYIEDMSS